MPYTPLTNWRPDIIKDLRVLFRYAVGCNSARTAVPDWHEFCESLEPHAAVGDAEIKRRRDRYTDQLNHFKDQKNSLDFDDAGPNPKLDYMREQLFKFYRDRPEARSEMFDYHKSVFNSEDLQLSDIKIWLAKIYEGRPDSPAIKRLPGVYHLYRFGALEHGKPTIVRSAMIISRGAVGSDEHLLFEILYPATTEKGTQKTNRVKGIILCVLLHYYFIGSDEGAKRAPYQLIAKQHTEDAAPEELAGLQMRHSHNTDVLASRIVIVRVSADMHGNAKPEKYRAEFEVASQATGILTPDSFHKDPRITDRLMAKIMNTIDTERAPVLWLLPDEKNVPPVPSEPRTVRRAGR